MPLNPTQTTSLVESVLTGWLMDAHWFVPPQSMCDLLREPMHQQLTGALCPLGVLSNFLTLPPPILHQLARDFVQRNVHSICGSAVSEAQTQSEQQPSNMEKTTQEQEQQEDMQTSNAAQERKKQHEQEVDRLFGQLDAEWPQIQH